VKGKFMPCFDFEFKGTQLVDVAVDYQATISIEADTKKEAQEKLKLLKDSCGYISAERLKKSDSILNVSWSQEYLEPTGRMYQLEHDAIEDEWYLPQKDLISAD